jgi:hypothetical protein
MNKGPLSATVILAAAAVLTSACGFKSGSSGPLAPTASSTPPAGVSNNSNPSSTPSLVGQWSSTSLASLPTPSSCSGFQYQISQQTTSSIAGTFSGTCAGGVQISGNASGQLNGTAVLITITGNAMIGGVLPCAFSLSGNGDVEDNGNTLHLPYSGTTCFGPVSGTEVLHRPQPASAPQPTPTPAPTPAPTPPPAPAPGPTSNDQMDLSQAAVYNSPPDIANWAVTSTITRLDMNSSSGLNVEFTTKDSWPDYVPPGFDGPLEYTVWAVVNINGQWYTSGFIQMWRGRASTGAPILSNFAINWAYDARWGPMAGYQPHAGELMGFFVSAGNARNFTTVSSLRERSNVVVVPLPAGDNGSFGFSLGRRPFAGR